MKSDILLSAAAILAGGLLPTNPTQEQMRRAAAQAVELARLIVAHEFETRDEYRSQRFDELLRRE